MGRFSFRNSFAWLGGATGALAVLLFQLGTVDGRLGALMLALAAVGGVTWIALRLSEYLHGRRLAEFALTHGWRYTPQSYGQTAGLSGFPFSAGSERTVTDVIEGTYDGRACCSYTLTIRLSAGERRKVEQVFTVTQTSLDFSVPRVDLIPEDIGTRVLGAISSNDIELESAEFNRTWHLSSQDRRFAVDIMDPRMMHALLDHRVDGTAIRVEGNKVAVWSAGRAPLETLARRFGLVTVVARRVPAHVAKSFSDLEKGRREADAAREANAPYWAREGGVLNSGTYTGIGADGDGVEDPQPPTR